MSQTALDVICLEEVANCGPTLSVDLINRIVKRAETATGKRIARLIVVRRFQTAVRSVFHDVIAS